MGLVSLASDSVPSTTFTPQEPLVELLRVSLSEDAVLVMASAQDKGFLFTWLVKEWAWSIRHQVASIVILVRTEKQATLWRDLFSRSTDLKPHCLEAGGGQINSHGLFVETVQVMDQFFNDNPMVASWLKISLMIVDNGHCLLTGQNGRRSLQSYASMRHSSSRLIVVTSGILDNAGDRLSHLDDQLKHLEKFYSCQTEASCELMSLLRFIANPRLSIVQFSSPMTASQIEIEIEAVSSRCLEFLESHTYSLFDTYGEEYLDLIQDIPDPVELPLKILQDFIYVTRTLGVWCAERASLVLLIKLDKLKTREKYERHFLLLSMIYTEMVRIRRLCNIAFAGLTEKEKIEKFSKPKVLKLVQVLRQYKPEHIQTPGHHKKAKPAPPTVAPGEPQLTPHIRRTRGHYSSYDDPNALCGVIFVKSKFASKLLYHFLKDLSRSEDAFSFLMPQYATTIAVAGDLDAEDDDTLDVEAERRKQEEALRRFRMKECNILVSNSKIEVGIDSVRCNLVVAFDPPEDFHSFAQYKVKAKSQKSSFFLIFSDGEQTQELVDRLSIYQVTEERLKARCTLRGPVNDDVTEADQLDNLLPPFVTRLPRLNAEGVATGDVRPAASLKTAIFYLNRYCAKLPSDTFTRLTALYHVTESTPGQFTCSIQLPINSPYKETIVGPAMPSLELSKRAAALETCKRLHQIKELDDYMLPIGKDGPKKEWEPKPSAVTLIADKIITTEEIVLEEIAELEEIISEDVTQLERLTLVDDERDTKTQPDDDEAELNVDIGRETEEKKDTQTGDKMDTEAVENLDTQREVNMTAVKIEEKMDTQTGEIIDTQTEEKIETSEKKSLKRDQTDSQKDALSSTATICKSVSKSDEKRSKTPSVDSMRDTRPGSTKRRQYYYKQVAECLMADRGERFHLYALRLKLTCAIPDDQNTRGRSIFDPLTSTQCFGMLVREPLPALCEFPIYTRSGEVFVDTDLLSDDVTLSPEEKELVFTFHRYTFSTVLRLEKYPMTFSPDEADNKVIILPLRNGSDIDWNFLRSIDTLKDAKLEPISDEARADFQFDEKMYADAVVMPWYRNQDQPQYFYVAEICSHLSPKSDFPGQGFETFEKYYTGKYKIKINNLDQPLLDVDHTSARLNFLTPRYVNRKGVALPTSSEETKRNKRENLEQKQILVPELCSIHPFPASLWKHAVCLPCIMYRLNSLLIADQLRMTVAGEMSFGLAKPEPNKKWPSLTFGWTLSEVLQNRTIPEEEVEVVNLTPKQTVKKGKTLDEKKSTEFVKQNSTSSAASENTDKGDIKDSDELGSLSSKLLNKLAEEESKLKKTTNLEIGTWSNEMAEKADNLYDDEDEDEFDEDELEWLDPNIALPDNLTFIDKTFLPRTDQGGRDWGTGIQQKTFRVGSPTFFSNPNINIPGMMDEMDGFSCSDSEDEDFNPVEVRPDEEEEEVVAGGLVRIEFRAGNTAEAIEDEDENNRRVETLAREKAEEDAMLENAPWDWSTDLAQNESLSEAFDRDVAETKSKLLKTEFFILEPDVVFTRSLASNEHQPSVTSVTSTTTKAATTTNTTETSKQIFSPSQTQLFLEDCKNNIIDLEPFSHVAEMIRKGQCRPKDFSQLRSGIIARASDPVLTFSFDNQPDLSNHPGPSPSLILQALTMSNSNDAINLERLETIGDSFLKYSITSFLFCVNGSVHEGRLSHLRSKQVSNLNLYRLGCGKNLGLCMVATKFEPHDNWLPPCYHVPRELEQALIMSGVPASHWNMADLPDLKNLDSEQICSLVREKIGLGVGGGGPTSSIDKVESMPSFVPYNLLTQHSIPDKSIADCVEALIGAYLISCGPQGALLFMTWLGLTVLPQGDTGSLIERRLPIPVSPLLDISTHLEVDHLLDGYDVFEELIGYRFHDRSYLLQAFSHASYYPNRFTDCYQRLEFLGDAVLDYLITRQLFEDPRLHSPGALTDLRSALVNNSIFASLAVKFQFHKFFKFFSPGLQTVINRFVKIQADNGYAVAEDFYLLDEDDSEEAEDIEVPKSLGDIFESVAGAIFLDSKLSLDAVWRVYYRMMKPEIDKYSQNVPKSPIRELLELEPETAKFGKPEKLADGRRVRVSVEVFGKGVFKGIGRNYRIAKCTAAKCALRALKKNERHHGNSKHSRNA